MNKANVITVQVDVYYRFMMAFISDLPRYNIEYVGKGSGEPADALYDRIEIRGAEEDIIDLKIDWMKYMN